MITLEKQLNNTTDQSFSYMVEQLARVQINVSQDGTITVQLVNNEQWDENFAQIASQSTGFSFKS
jgi:cell division protein FtsB